MYLKMLHKVMSVYSGYRLYTITLKLTRAEHQCRMFQKPGKITTLRAIGNANEVAWIS